MLSIFLGKNKNENSDKLVEPFEKKQGKKK